MLSSLSLLTLTYFLIYFNHFYDTHLYHQYSFGSITIAGSQFLTLFYGVYAIGIVCLSLFYKKSHISFSEKVWRSILSPKLCFIAGIEQTALLSLIIKLFFGPMVFFWFLNSIEMIFSLFINQTFSFHFFILLSLHILIAIDTLMFIIGYSFEHLIFRNKTKSVDRTFIGWSAALICYPPFNDLPTQILGWYCLDIGLLLNESIILALLMLCLLTIFVWASLALNFKASNLSNKGIVISGPYRYIRHPAYTAKVLSWWVSLIPIFWLSLKSGDFKHIFLVLSSILFWSGIYIARALTEERHLMNDSDYQKYMESTKFRFLPKLI